MLNTKLTSARLMKSIRGGLIAVISLLAFISTLSHAAKSENPYLEQYRNMTNQAYKQALSHAPPPPQSANPATMTNGQAALIPNQPAAPVTSQPLPNNQPAMTTQQSAEPATNHNGQRPTNSGPVNIFATPGSDSSNSAPIHY